MLSWVVINRLSPRQPRLTSATLFPFSRPNIFTPPKPLAAMTCRIRIRLAPFIQLNPFPISYFQTRSKIDGGTPPSRRTEIPKWKSSAPRSAGALWSTAPQVPLLRSHPGTQPFLEDVVEAARLCWKSLEQRQGYGGRGLWRRSIGRLRRNRRHWLGGGVGTVKGGAGAPHSI